MCRFLVGLFLLLYLTQSGFAEPSVGLKTGDVLIYSKGDRLTSDLCYYAGKPYSPGSVIVMEAEQQQACCKNITDRQAVWKPVKTGQTPAQACTTYD